MLNNPGYSLTAVPYQYATAGYHRNTHTQHFLSHDALNCVPIWLPPITFLLRVFVCAQDYKLNFGLWEQHVENAWHGGVATIEFCPGAEVWGVIWTLSNENLTSLDR